MSRTVLVINPKSANGKTAAEADAILNKARAVLGTDVEALHTQHQNHATELTAQALDGGASCVMAVGGDGTNNEVINGFFRPDGTVRSPEASFAFLPRGTGGDFRRTFGFGKQLDAALQRAGKPGVPTDVGVVDYTDHQGGRGRRHYINISGAGLSGIVVKTVNQTSKSLGAFSFVVGTLKGLMAFHPYAMKITVDGQPFHDGPAALCVAANGRYFGGGMQIAPGAAVDDGLLSVVCLPGWTTLGFVSRSLTLFAGDVRRSKGVKESAGKVVQMESSDPEVLLDVDGEQPGRLPATFSVLPGAVRVCRTA